jgi:hypothetical protein
MRQWIINLLLKKVVGVTIPDDIIRDIKGTLYLGDLPLSQEELRMLVSEAKALEKMRLWSIVNETMKQKCYEKGWKNSTNIEHLNIAKAEYAVLDTQESIIKIIKNKII